MTTPSMPHLARSLIAARAFERAGDEAAAAELHALLEAIREAAGDQVAALVNGLAAFAAISLDELARVRCEPRDEVLARLLTAWAVSEVSAPEGTG